MPFAPTSTGMYDSISPCALFKSVLSVPPSKKNLASWPLWPSTLSTVRNVIEPPLVTFTRAYEGCSSEDMRTGMNDLQTNSPPFETLIVTRHPGA